MDDTINYYSYNAAHFQTLYDSVNAEEVHASWKHLLNDITPGVALDVGAGSGRDARWLAAMGWQVVACEPATGLREKARSVSVQNINWRATSLPYLNELPTENASYDLILLSAVWMHVPPHERANAFSRLVDLLSRNGFLIISLRYGPNDYRRPMYAVSEDEIHHLAESNDVIAKSLTDRPTHDNLNRTEVTWQTIQVCKE